MLGLGLEAPSGLRLRLLRVSVRVRGTLWFEDEVSVRVRGTLWFEDEV